MPYMDPMGMVQSTVIPVFEWVNSSKKNISVAETNPIAGSWTCCRRRPTRSVWADSRASCARWRTRCGETFRGGGLGFLEKKLLGKYESSCGWFEIPIGSMYAIYGNIYHLYTPNVSISIPAPWIRHGKSEALFFVPSRRFGDETIATSSSSHPRGYLGCSRVSTREVTAWPMAILPKMVVAS